MLGAQRGIEHASGDWVVTFDADVRPLADLPRSLVVRANEDRLDLVTLAIRAECTDPGGRWLHAALLTTLVLRFGPAGAAGGRLASGQCMVFPRQALLDAGGLAPVRGEVVEDVALARHLTVPAGGWRCSTDVRSPAWRAMARSPRRGEGGGARSGCPAWTGLAPRRAPRVLGLTTGALVPRLLARRTDAVDVVVLALRLGTLVGTARAFRPWGVAYWSSPLADGVAVACLGAGLVRPQRSWRGRRTG